MIAEDTSAQKEINNSWNQNKSGRKRLVVTNLRPALKVFLPSFYSQKGRHGTLCPRKVGPCRELSGEEAQGSSWSSGLIVRVIIQTHTDTPVSVLPPPKHQACFSKAPHANSCKVWPSLVKGYVTEEQVQLHL
jgi:hypothetical protein